MKKIVFSLCVLACFGCTPSKSTSKVEQYPVFIMEWSEYPSWAAFGVAAERGLVNPKQGGKHGPIEEKWKVDLVFQEADYDTCITLFGSKSCDAVCMTNMDVVKPSLTRKSVAIMPTSTSDGADACIVVNFTGDVKNPEDVKNFLSKNKTYGLAKSVSELVFADSLVKIGLNSKDFEFSNMDPAAAAQSLQTNQANVNSIMVWNPFVLQTLRTRSDSKVLFSSSDLKEEVIDCMIMGADSLEREGGDRCACALCDCYYQLNKLLADPSVGDEVLVQVGAKFSNLNLEDMKIVVDQTKFFGTPTKGIEIFKSQLMKDNMEKILSFCKNNQISDVLPSVGVDKTANSGEQLIFTTEFMEKVSN